MINKMSTDNLVMSIPEFARACSISSGLAYRLARENRLPIPVIRLGRRLVLSRKAVELLLQGEGIQEVMMIKGKGEVC
jgi:predicted DNA-binding transcriptional regulator AlpA